jgi:hypothetical protein
VGKESRAAARTAKNHDLPGMTIGEKAANGRAIDTKATIAVTTAHRRAQVPVSLVLPARFPCFMKTMP